MFFRKKSQKEPKLWLSFPVLSEKQIPPSTILSRAEFENFLHKQLRPLLLKNRANFVSYNSNNPTFFQEKNPIAIDLSKGAKTHLLLLDRNGKEKARFGLMQISNEIRYQVRIQKPGLENVEAGFDKRDDAIAYIGNYIKQNGYKTKRDPESVDFWMGKGKDKGLVCLVLIVFMDGGEPALCAQSADAPKMICDYLPDWLGSE